MDHFIDIRVLPDPEFGETTLMSALFAKLHRALTDVGNGEIGVSFPNANKTLGNLLRLHGSQLALARLMQETWLQGLRDYCECSTTQPIPDQHSWCLVQRLQPQKSTAKLRRLVKRNSLTEERAKELINDRPQLKAPFIQIRSNSSGHVFKLFIKQQVLSDPGQDTRFSSYGLSNNSPVPWF